MVRPATEHYHSQSSETAEALEQRVRRLEDAVAAMQDTQLMEDRVVERIVQRVDHLPPHRSESRGLILEATQMLLPKLVEAPPANGLPEPDGRPAADSSAPVRPTWLLFDVARDFRAIVRMLADYRYRMTWTSRLVVIAAVGVAVLSWLFLSGNFFGVGTVFDRAILVVVVAVIYKVLSREVERYRELLSRIYRYR